MTMSREFDIEGRDRKAFKTPDNYFQNLPEAIMNSLPDKQDEEMHTGHAQKVSMMDRMGPLLYLAAVFAGLGLFFRYLVMPITQTEEKKIAETEVVADDSATSPIEASTLQCEDYYAALEDMYAEHLIDEYLYAVE